MPQLGTQGSRLRAGFRTWEYKLGAFKLGLFIAPMFSRLTTALALALALVSFSTPATAASPCGVCSPFMFFSGVNRTLTLQREEEMNTVQCDYSGGNLPSPIVIPYCLYANINGAVLVTNTGPTLTSVPGACPSIKLITGVACTGTPLKRE
ncbi:hypothetical protein B0H13DRAFT_2327081 [Mycena leptocephala]|nr:hypothetical protein B0H13DRAFT_2327081 [Mycena leptocephala]